MQCPRPLRLVIPALCLLALAACEQLGIEDGKAIEAEGKAVGAACRHSGRALEDCYQLNPKAPKAAVFAGWKEMNDYMTEQKLEVIKPTLPPALPKQKKKAEADTEAEPGNDAADAEHETNASAPNGHDKEADAKAKKANEKTDGKSEAKAEKPGTHKSNAGGH
ncbi:hypothetical protein GCM10025771_29590 [Niveibacterium umoris]|uniref:Uncharacterized protein n=1 Tax=Niveibacterium umoris TaxID=1193620 RepID=A0A840BJT0_9RHOO|nr:hypothetical protein [Niveibacterium umoris]